jgi:hypothetical protein
MIWCSHFGNPLSTIHFAPPNLLTVSMPCRQGDEEHQCSCAGTLCGHDKHCCNDLQCECPHRGSITVVFNRSNRFELLSRFATSLGWPIKQPGGSMCRGLLDGLISKQPLRNQLMDVTQNIARQSISQTLQWVTFIVDNTVCMPSVQQAVGWN